jgi:hypothetical protein
MRSPDAIARQGTRGHIGVAAMTDAQWARAGPVAYGQCHRPRTEAHARAVAATFHIRLGTIRDWEQGRYEPDAAARAYLRVTVRKALAAEPKPSP